jgi:spore germination protein (amino acid permease)
MPEKERISTRQFIWMLFIIITTVTALQTPGLLISIGHRDAWMSVFGGMIYDGMLAIVYAYLGLWFPNENFVQYSISILGKFMGRIVGICFPLYFLLVCGLVMKSLGYLIHTAFLPKTSLPLIWLSGFIVIAYAARQGIEVIGRASEILGPIYFTSVIFLGLILIPAAKIERLKPILEDGIVPVMKGSTFIATLYGICIMMAMFIPICNKPENGFLAKISGLSLGGVLMGITTVFSIMVFGYEHSLAKISPVLSLTRMVRIGYFFERFEIIWILVAVGAGIVACSQMMWAFSVGISQIFGVKDYKPLVLSSSFLAFVICYTALENQVELGNYIQFTLSVISVFVQTFLEILLFAAALALNRRGTSSS